MKETEDENLKLCHFNQMSLNMSSWCYISFLQANYSSDTRQAIIGYIRFHAFLIVILSEGVSVNMNVYKF